MIHFFPRYTKDASDTPFGAELRRLGVPFRFFGDVLSHRYRTRFELIVVLHSRLLWFAIRSAFTSLVRARPAPRVVVINSDVEAYVFGIVRGLTGLLPRRRPLVVWETFIYVPRGGLLGWLHRRYIGGALLATDIAVCHSRLEVQTCQQRFAGHRTRFVFIPFCTTLTARETLIAEYGAAADAGDQVATAGKSGRDYATLARAAATLPCHLRIVCDLASQTAGIEAGERVELLRACYGMDYVRVLAQAQVVVIPLAVNDVSAGQMVLLQAFALRKPVIITRTPTTEDYATDEVDALMVPMGDEAALHAALQRLLGDAALRARLAAAGERRYLEVNSTEAYVRQLVALVEGPGATPLGRVAPPAA